MQETPNRTISLRELNWDDVDSFANKHGFKDRSPFVEFCLCKEIYKKHLGDMRIYEIIVLLMMALSSMLLILIFMRG